MGSVAAGWVLTGIAGGLLLTGAIPAAAFVAVTAIVVVVTAPETEREAARKRNQARRIR